MSKKEVRKATMQDICWAQELIEKYLLLHCTPKEIVHCLSRGARFEPVFTKLVWQNLEEQNKKFFRTYYIRLMLIDQIKRFNEQIERQVELMQQMDPQGASVPLTNGSQFHSTNETPLPVGPSENMHQVIQTMPDVYTNGASYVQPLMQVAGNTGAPAVRVDRPENYVPAQSSNPGVMMQGMNGGMMMSDDAYTLYNGGHNGLGEPHKQEPYNNTLGQGSYSVYNGGNCSSQGSNEPMPGPYVNSSGFFGPSNLTADFSTDPENYSGSPFLNANGNTQGTTARVNLTGGAVRDVNCK